MDLAEAHGELVSELHYVMEQVLVADSISEMGDEFDSLVEHFEALGLCHLQEFMDVDEFRLCLVHAAQARRYFLRRCRVEGATSLRHLALARNSAFLCGLAAGVLPLARDLAVESISTWNAAWEYEDDFALRALLHVLAAAPSPFPRAQLLAKLTQFEGALDGEHSTRFDVAKAIVDRDAGAFEFAMIDFLEGEESARVDEKDAAGLGEDAILFWPRAHVSIEGLAFLKAGELCSLSIARELVLCPRVARVPWTAAHFPDLFESLGLAADGSP